MGMTANSKVHKKICDITGIKKNDVGLPLHSNCCSLYFSWLFSDFGVDKLVKLSQETKFPWLLSNVFDNLNDKPLAEGKTSHMIEWQGVKVRTVRDMKSLCTFLILTFRSLR